MGITDFFKNAKELVLPTKFVGLLKEAKGEVEQDVSKRVQFLLPKDAEPRHEDFSVKRLKKIYLDDPFIFGSINKIVDFVVSPGFSVVSKDDRVVEVCKQFIRDNQFSSLLRNFVLDGLICGNAFLELSGKKDKAPDGIKIIDPENMFVRRDVKGVVL